MTLRSHLKAAGALTAAAALLQVTASHATPATVWTQHYDNSRTGANLQETVLNTTNVQMKTFGKLFSIPVDGQIYAQPLYIPALTVGGAVHNVLYIATMENSLYAADADTGAILWQKNYGTPVPSNDVQCCCTDIIGDIGILSTPVIDTATSTLYLLERNKNADGTYHQWIRAVDLATGADKFNSPREIAATYNGMSFNPRIENQRPALTLANGNVYIAWASHTDCGDFHGWVISYQASDVSKQSAVWSATTGSFTQGGIWMSGQGLTVDAAGNLYLITGNGAFDGVTCFGDSIVKLTGGLTLADYFTPSNQAALNSVDNDLGSGGVLGLPGTNDIIGGGKDGRLFLLNTANLGQYNAGTDQVVQEFQGVALNSTTTHIHGSPVYWNSPVTGPTIYIWGEHDHGNAYAFGGTTFNSTPAASTKIIAPGGMPGGILSISANGSATGSGILWVDLPYNQSAVHQTVAGVLHAYDASNLGKELWNSYQNQARDDFGNLAKFCPAVVSNGKVYQATFSNQVTVYGLLTLTPTGLAATPSSGQMALKWNASANATFYVVKRALSASGPFTTLGAAATTRYTDTGLTNGTTYFYTVAAGNISQQSADSAPVSATPLSSMVPPAVPGGVSAVGGNNTVDGTPGSAGVTLSWNATDTATSYHVKRGPSANGPFTVIANPATPTFTDTGLTAGTVYYYRISALNAYGESGYSPPVGVTPIGN
jgi:hypothetical protein